MTEIRATRMPLADGYGRLARPAEPSPRLLLGLATRRHRPAVVGPSGPPAVIHSSGMPAPAGPPPTAEVPALRCLPTPSQCPGVRTGRPDTEENDMLVRLADWCYRNAVGSWSSPGSPPWWARFALAGAFGGELKQDYLQPGSESKAAADTLEKSFPQKAGDTIQIVVHSEDGVTSPEVQARAEAIFTDVADSDHVVGVASPFADGGAAADLRGRHHGVRRGRPRPARQRLHPRPRPRHWSNPSSPPATTPCRSRSAARSPRCPRRPRSAPKASGCSPPPSSCCSPSGPRSRWGCR